MRRVLFCCSVTLAWLSRLPGANAVTPGRFVVEPPTLICLEFEWYIAGDENRNASVEVSYRKTGENGWQEALPLLRMARG